MRGKLEGTASGVTEDEFRIELAVNGFSDNTAKSSHSAGSTDSEATEAARTAPSGAAVDALANGSDLRLVETRAGS
jgi:hypothetical protein